MANVKISALPAGPALTGIEEHPAAVGGVTVKYSTDEISTFVQSDLNLAPQQVLYGGGAGAIAQTATWTFDDVALRMQFGAAHVASTGTSSGSVFILNPELIKERSNHQLCFLITLA